ncbi:MAG: hypothetical protein OXL34_01805 [Gemmatimonadota bacterium]|nr:hypothetical protein [Gemmatimonadota bacterium]
MNMRRNVTRDLSTDRLALITPALLAVLLGASACRDDAGSASPDTIESWSLSEEPTVVIGGTDEREGYLLHRIFGATRLGDGRIVVANGSSLELKYYDPGGRHLFNSGGQGEGPGEFRSFGGFTRLPGDSVLVESWSKLTRFGPDGRQVSTSEYELPPRGRCTSIEGGHRLLPDGSILLVISVFVGLSADHEECPAPSEPRPPATIARFDPATGLLDTIAVLPDAEKVYGIESQYAYAKNLVHGIGRDRVYLGDTGSDTILAMGLGGDTLAILPVPFEAAMVPADAREKAFEDREWTGGGQTITERTTFIYPDNYPRYARLVAAPGERVWVMAYPSLTDPVMRWVLVNPQYSLRLDEGALWRVVNSDGRAIAEVRTPPGFFLLEVGDDHVLGLHKDELERESVQVHRLIR